MPIDQAAAKLETAFRAAVEARGTPSTHAHGAIVDDADNRNQFAYASALSRATGLDFVQLAAVELEHGAYGVSQLIDALPPGEPAGDEARRLRAVYGLGSGLHQAESEAFLGALPSREACLDALVESWALRTAEMPPDGFGPAAYPSAARASQATGLDYHKLATIEHKGGRTGLRRALELIPGLPPVALD